MRGGRRDAVSGVARKPRSRSSQRQRSPDRAEGRAPEGRAPAWEGETSPGMRAIEAYLGSGVGRLSQHHIDSYNEFIASGMQKIIDEGNRSFVMIKNEEVWSADFRVTVRDLRFRRPRANVDGAGAVDALPNLCRVRGETYAADTTVTVDVEVDDHRSGTKATQTFEGVTLCRMPIMMRSVLCYLSGADREAMWEAGEDPDDPGGYFVVSGAEKVMVTQERVAPNRPVVTVRTDEDGHRETVLTLASAPMDDSVDSITVQVVVSSRRRGAAFVRFPGRLVSDANVATVFRALGVESDEDIVGHVAIGARGGEIAEMLRPSLVAGGESGIWTQRAAVEALALTTPYGSNPVSIRSDKTGSRGRNQLMYQLRREFLSGVGEGFPGKAVHLGLLVGKALCAHSGIEGATDRESMGVKRMFTTGMLLKEVFREAYGRFKREATNAMDRAWHYGPWRGSGDLMRVVNRANLTTIFSERHITGTLNSSMRGNWGGHGDPSEGGIVQELSRMSWMMFLSHLRRTNNPIDREIKITSPHYLHPSQWGALCPVESPDGGNIGLTNNLALTCEVTASRPSGPVIELAESLGASPLRVPEDGEFTVWVNWVPAMVTRDPVAIAERVRAARRSGGVHCHTSVRLDIPNRELRLFTDGGRCTRPMAVVGRAGAPAISGSWEDMLSSGSVEYVDTEEAEDTLVAWSAEQAGPGHTHAELHVLAGLSVLEATMPFMQHNQAARNVLAAQQGKQAAGVPSLAFRIRMDVASMTLNYPELPLVTTRLERAVASDSHPCGANAIVAIMTFTGFNMEDAVIVNKGAAERGLFGVTYTKTYSVDEEDGDGVEIRLGNPRSVQGLDHRGLPPEGTAIGPGSPIYCRVVSRPGAGPEDNVSLADDNWEGFYCDRVFVHTRGSSPLMSATVRCRQSRPPAIGDKMAARHAQKGVVGALVPEHLMPHTPDGIVPDIVINPHGFPTRMTVGQMYECVAAKACAAATASRVDATSFSPPDMDSLRSSLASAGYPADGTEAMTCPSGFTMSERVFVGPTYYQRLKQMSGDKISYRGNVGARDSVTRQPVGGRSRGGGGRVGEMEFNSVVAHGTMGFAGETNRRADGSTGSWSDANGLPAVYNESADIFRPSSAPPFDARFTRSSVPRALCALRHEMAGMGIDMRLLFSDPPPFAPSESAQKPC